MRIRMLALMTVLGLAACHSAAAGQKQDANPKLLIEQGRAQIAAGNPDEAIRLLTLAREGAPTDPAVYNALAAAYQKLGSEPMAVAQLEKAIELDSTQIEPRMQLAEIHAHNRRWNEAARLYRDTLRHDPKNDAAALQLGHLYLKAKQPASGARVLAGYVGRHPEDEAVATEYLDALGQAGQEQALAEAAESILASKPDWVPALQAAARARARSGPPKSALEHFERLEAKQSLRGEDALLVGKCHLDLGEEAAALPWFERALADTVQGQTDWSQPAAAFMRAKQWPVAARLYERKLSQDSTAVSAWINLALCKQQMKEYEPARRALLRAVALRPEAVPSRYALAVNYVQMDSTRAARRAYENVVRLAAGHEDEYREELRQSYRYLSVMNLMDKNWNGTLTLLDQALRYDPKDVALRLYRAQSLLATNRKAEAKQEFEMVLKMQPENKEAKKGLTLLAQYN